MRRAWSGVGWSVVALSCAAVLAVAALAACGGTKQSTATLPAPTVAGTIVYAAQEGGSNGSGIYIVNTDGTGGKLLVGGPKDQCSPAWSPDGTKLAYSNGSGDAYYFTIWVVDANGSHRKQLTKVGEGSGTWPSWSPDGRHIAFMRFTQRSAAEETDSYNIAVMNADGSEITDVSESRPKSWDCLPTWASNDKVLFLQAGSVCEANMDGTGLTRLTTTGTVGGYALSPDGTSLAVFDEASNSVVVTPLGAAASSVTLVEKVRQYVPAPRLTLRWTADGKTLLIGNCGWGAWSAVKGAPLFVVGADGSGLSQVPGVDYVVDPEWQPQ